MSSAATESLGYPLCHLPISQMPEGHFWSRAEQLGTTDEEIMASATGDLPPQRLAEINFRVQSAINHLSCVETAGYTRTAWWLPLHRRWQ